MKRAILVGTFLLLAGCAPQARVDQTQFAPSPGGNQTGDEQVKPNFEEPSSRRKPVPSFEELISQSPEATSPSSVSDPNTELQRRKLRLVPDEPGPSSVSGANTGPQQQGGLFAPLKKHSETASVTSGPGPKVSATPPSLRAPREAETAEHTKSEDSTDTEENAIPNTALRAPIDHNDLISETNRGNAFYADPNRGVVLDEGRAIMWTAEASPTMMTYREALLYCRDLTLAKHSDWRLPTKDELSSIVDTHLAQRIPDSKVVPLYSPFSKPSEGYLFSGTPVSGYEGAPWIMNLRNGHIFNGQGYRAYVRAVRNMGVGTTQQTTPNIVEMAIPAVVQIVVYDITGTRRGLGTGFFVASGRILTNAHVVEDAYSAEVLSDAQYYDQITVLKSDEDIDLALLSVEDRGESTLEFQNTQEIRPGQQILTIGSPMGLEKTVSDGLVSAIRGIPGQLQIIQISAPISPGSSGGPVLSQEGHVVGIASATLSEGQNLNFAIGIQTIMLFLQEPDAPQQLKKAGSRVLWRAVLRWIGILIAGLIALIFGGGWWIVVIVVMIVSLVGWILKSIYYLVAAPFRRRRD